MATTKFVKSVAEQAKEGQVFMPQCGLAPGFVGLYQVNAQVPDGLAPGLTPLLISVNLAHSNEVKILVQ